MKNVIYYEKIEHIGGVSTYEYELAFKYFQTKDITLYFRVGNAEQISRLRKYIRVKKWNGEDIECDNFLTNYSFESFIPHVKLSGKGHSYQVIHAMYKTNGIKPKVNDFFDYYICVSDIAKQEYQELTGLPDSKFIVSHNPLTITKDDLKPSLVIGVFQRLKGAYEKGEGRIKALIDKLDVAKVKYLMIVASDSKPFYSRNITYIEPRAEGIRNIMALCDVMLCLSDCEGDNYTTKEAKSVGCKVLATPIPSLIENKVIDKTLEFDLSNIDECVDWLKELYENKEPRQLNYKAIEDKYESILLDGKSDYREEQEVMKVRVLVNGVKSTDGRELPIGYIKEVEDSKEIRTYINNGWLEEVKVVEPEDAKPIKKESKVSDAVKEPKEVKKAVRKTTKK